MPDRPLRGRATDRRFQFGALVVCLVVAGLISLIASSAPDGLNKVAAEVGFASGETDSAVAGSPAAGYEASFLDGLLGSSLVRVIGVLVTLALAIALFRVLGRGRAPRRPDDAAASHRD